MIKYLLILIIFLQACSSAHVYLTSEDCFRLCDTAKNDCKYNCNSDWRSCTKECIGLTSKETLMCNIRCDTEYEQCFCQCKDEGKSCIKNCNELKAKH